MNAVDTNVLVYSCDKRDPSRQERAREVMRSLETPVLLWQVACEFIAASRKLAPHGFTAEAAWRQLGTLIEAWPLAVSTPEVLVRAERLHRQEQVSFWDALLYGACLEVGVKRLYSEDLPGGPINGLEIVNPFA